MTQQIQLTTINISLQTYGPNEGKYTGEVRFKGVYGAVEIVLSPSISEKILALCAEGLMQNTRELAETLTANILVSQTTLPAPAPKETTDDDIPF